MLSNLVGDENLHDGGQKYPQHHKCSDNQGGIKCNNCRVSKVSNLFLKFQMDNLCSYSVISLETNMLLRLLRKTFHRG